MTRRVSRDRVRADRIVLAFLLSLVWCPFTARSAKAEESFAGTWRAGPLQVRVQVDSWGGDCGPRPPARSTEPGGEVEITESGDHLRLRGAVEGRTDGCWTRNRSVRRVSTRVQSNTWRAVCRTPEEDPRAEQGTYTLRAAGPDKLVFKEHSEYDWELNRSRCTAERTATRTFERIDSDAPESAPDSETESEQAETTDEGCTPGRPVGLRLKPKRTEIEPGEQVCIRAGVIDAEGCPLTDRPIRWELESSQAPGGELRGRCFRAADNTAEAEGTFRILARSGAFRSEAIVTVRAPDLSDLIAAGRRRPSTPSDDPQDEPTTDEASRVAARSTDDSSEGGVLGSVIAVGSVLVLVFVVVILLVRRRRPRTDDGEDGEETPSDPETGGPRSEGGVPVASAAPPKPPVLTCAVCDREFQGDTMFCPVDGARLVDPAEAGTRMSQGMICPACRRGYPSDARFCPHDSEELVPYGMFAARQHQPDESRGSSKICPECGDRYELGVRFCGKDGAELVLVN